MWNRFFAAGVYRVRPLADRREMTFFTATIERESSSSLVLAGKNA